MIEVLLDNPILLVSLAVLVVIVVYGLANNRIVKKKKFVSSAMLVEYLLLVVCAAVVFRQPLSERLLHLRPLWVYTDFAKSNPSFATRDIVINLLLLMPVGALLAGINPSLKWYKVLLIGLACSLTIEVLQYAFLRGVAQTDDLLHNSVSCLLGWGVAKGVVTGVDRKTM